MVPEMLKRQDISVYAVAGVPKSFKKKLQKFVEDESKTSGEVMLMDENMTHWIVARLRGQKRRTHEQTPASSALWRAYRALSAAVYHLQERQLEQEIRMIRVDVERLWRQTSPLHRRDGDEAAD